MTAHSTLEYAEAQTWGLISSIPTSLFSVPAHCCHFCVFSDTIIKFCWCNFSLHGRCRRINTLTAQEASAKELHLPADSKWSLLLSLCRAANSTQLAFQRHEGHGLRIRWTHRNTQTHACTSTHTRTCMHARMSAHTQTHTQVPSWHMAYVLWSDLLPRWMYKCPLNVAVLPSILCFGSINITTF